MTTLRTWGRLAAALLALSAAARPAAAQVNSTTILFEVKASVPPSLPQPVTDLTANVGVSTAQVEGRVTLNWTAPDAYTPTQGEPNASYIIKYATFSADSLLGGTTAWWNSATFTLNVATPPAFPGTTESVTLDTLEPGATMFFAIKSINAQQPPQTSLIDTKAAAAGQQASVPVPNMVPPQPTGLTPTLKCGQVGLDWVPLNPVTVYDFSHYKMYQSSFGTSGPFELLTATGTVAPQFQTLRNLENFTDYFFQVRSYDQRGLESTSTVTMSTQSYPVPGSASSLVVTGSSVTPTLLVTWANPTGGGGTFRGGILVKTQGLALTGAPVDFSTYTVGNAMGNGSVVKKWNGTEGVDAERFIDANLAGGATYFYTVFNLYERGSAICYSAPVAGNIVLQPRPMPPSNVQFGLESTFGLPQLSWNKVTHFDSGAPMTLCQGGVCGVGETDGYPRNIELAGYNVYKSTCSAGGCPGASAWERVNTGGIIPKTTTTYIVGAPAVRTYYVVRAVNSFSFESANSNPVDEARQMHAVALDGDSVIAEATLSEALKAELLQSSHGGAADYTLELSVRSEDLRGSVVRSIEVIVRRGDNGQSVPGFSFKNGKVQLSLSNTDVTGLTTARFNRAANANLDIFWFNGVRYLPLNGDVNPATETVTINTSVTGIFQLRNTARTANFSFDPAVDLYPRVITPNDDGLNDRFFFNTKVAGVTGKVFDLRGAKVTDLQQCSGGPFGSNCLTWDGKVGGKTVHGGIYIYDLNGQGTHFTGTVVVAQ